MLLVYNLPVVAFTLMQIDIPRGLDFRQTNRMDRGDKVTLAFMVPCGVKAQGSFVI